VCCRSFTSDYDDDDDDDDDDVMVDRTVIPSSTSLAQAEAACGFMD